MTDKSATERLREMLDERGVEYETDDRYGLRETTWCGTAVFQLSPTAKMTMIATPEQAIAATLGSEFNPDGLPVGLTISDDGNLLNWRGENYVKQSTLGSGTLTAEQVRDAIRKHAHDDSCYIFEVYGEECDAIADELNAALGESDEGCYLMRDGKRFPVELDYSFIGIMPIRITVGGFRYLLEVPDGE